MKRCKALFLCSAAVSAFSVPAIAQLENGGPASAVIGQPNYNSATVPASVQPNIVKMPGGVAVDPVSGAVFVADRGNNRVLRFADAAKYLNGDSALGVLGQPDLVSNTAAATRNGMNLPFGIAFDSLGTLYVSEYQNNRVLIFTDAVHKPNGANADKVLGQPEFTSNAAATTANGMNFPLGIAVDGIGNLYVADSKNNRVLRFANVASKSNGDPANAVFGQANFTLNTAGVSQSAMNYPAGVAVDSRGNLYVADCNNNRVLRFASAAYNANGTNADAVLGQLTFTEKNYGLSQSTMNQPYGVAVDGRGYLSVADANNNRVLIFGRAESKTPGANADAVLGSYDFQTNIPGLSQRYLHTPVYVATNSVTKKIYVADQENNRFLVFDMKAIGTEYDPILIATYEDLKAMSPYEGNVLRKVYGLTSDIDAAASATENNGAGFLPITYFMGVFHGHGHVIKNLVIKPAAAYGSGLFGELSGTVDSLGILNCTVSCVRNVGGLAGVNDRGTIRDCWVTGSVSGDIYSGLAPRVGGLVGTSLQGSIIRCFSHASVNSTSGPIGGLVGASYRSTISYCFATTSVHHVGSEAGGGLIGTVTGGDSIISYCYSTGDVSGDYICGGLIGSNMSSSYMNVIATKAIVRNCFATGSVTSTQIAGGLVGINSGSEYGCEGILENCYATGDVSGGTASSAGGLVGMLGNAGFGSLKNCYATGLVTGAQGQIGALVGVAGYQTAAISASYWNTGTSGATKGIGATSDPLPDTGLTVAQMKTAQRFSIWDFSTVWTIRPDSTYPGLRKIDNAPFAFNDSLVAPARTFPLAYVLQNDCDIETARKNLVLRVVKISSGATDSVSTLTFAASAEKGAVDTVRYRVGEKRGGDTLWGNVATACITFDSTTAPLAVTLVSPVHGAVIVADSVRLVWNKAMPSVDIYYIEFSSDSQMSVKTVDSTAGDTAIMKRSLADGKDFWWRVRGRNATGVGAYSEVRKFSVKLPSAVASASAFSAALAKGAELRGNSVRFALSQAQTVRLNLYDCRGRLKKSVTRQYGAAGVYAIEITRIVDTRGVYFLELKAGARCNHLKLSLY
jgi:DNA-binding beta-propeller fold protein YncE